SGEIERVTIYLVDLARNELVLAAQHPLDFPARERIALSEDLMLTRAITGGRLVTTDDDVPEYTRDLMRKHGVTHGATLPLVRRGKLTGVIAVAKGQGRFSPDAFDFGAAVADKLVGSIEVERVFDEHAAASARLRAILASAPEGVLVISSDLRVVYANAPLIAILGYKGDITGWTLEDFTREMGPRLEDPSVL